MTRRLACLFVVWGGLALGAPTKTFRAGAATVDASPPKLPVIVNGGFLEKLAHEVNDPVQARALVLDDGATRLALVVVDSCMMPRELLDEAKRLASSRTGIPPQRMLISATHTHSAPSAMDALGSSPDPEYVQFLPGRIAEAIVQAHGQLQPARIGWSSVDDHEHTFTRRWIYRPDQMLTDPFGARSVRANMHPGYENPNAIAPSGPTDPQLSVLAVQSADGKPLALLANYSMHYFGAAPVSADYYGLFNQEMARIVGGGPAFVSMMSQGTSGDQMWMNYGKPKSSITITEYAAAVAQSALRAYRQIQYRDWVPLAMAQATLTLGRRVPDAARLAWARDLVATMGDRKPQNQPEVYAREQIYLHESPKRELLLQALRIGDLGITAIPNEVFAITGLKLKAQSPLAQTMNIELANGSEGYIPPPEQHKLGGYTTWPARTAGLEVTAEPKIVEALLGLLEKTAGKKRRVPDEARTEYARAVLGANPSAYWRLQELHGPIAKDASGRGRAASYEDGVAFYLPGPERASRAVHFAGGRVRALPPAGAEQSLALWLWTGHAPGAVLRFGDHPLTVTAAGLLQWGAATGRTPIPLRTWTHLVLVREGTRAAVYVNGSPAPELMVDTLPTARGPLIFGDGWEGKISEVALFERVLHPDEIARLASAGGGQ
jgi:hypothetical protein